jgi:hypothetical protein
MNSLSMMDSDNLNVKYTAKIVNPGPSHAGK